jgi:N-acetylglucosaminylphosphatidylinositol deacetylase
MGISSHPNHYSLYYGARRLLASLPPNTTPVRAYALTTYPILIKYSGWITLLSKLYPNSYQTRGAIASGLPALRFTSGIASYLTTFRAMSEHHSQMVWFRWLYLLFSSYMWRNDWIEIERQGELQPQKG